MRRILSTLLALLMLVSCFGVVASAKTSADILNEKAMLSGPEKNANSLVNYDTKLEFNEIATYEEYLATNKNLPDGTDKIVVDVANLATANATVQNGSKYPVTEGAPYNKVVYTSEADDVTFKFDVKKAGMYNIILYYHTVKGKDINIVREIQINGKTPFVNAAECTFTRSFADQLVEREDGTKGFKVDYLGNEIRPDQVETYQWKSQYVVDYLGYTQDPLKFAFKKGENTISLNAVKEPVVIGKIEIVPIKKTNDYATYIKQYSGAKKYSGEEIFMEGESASEKSDKTLYPSVDVSTASTSANGKTTDAYVQSVNVIGGTNWQYVQQAVTWTVGDNVKPGLYALNFKYRQNVNDGMRSPRKLYINGEVPFSEAKALEFGYTTEWVNFSMKTKDGEDCLVYLEPGDKITLEVTLSEMGKYLETANNVLTQINEIYRQIIKITGSAPDKYRDYQLDELIPEDLEGIKTCYEKLEGIIEGIEKYTGEKSSGLASINTLVRQMKEMYEDTDSIGKELAYFKTNVSSLGTWINSASYAPLEIDYVSLSEPGAELKEAEAGFFTGLWYDFNRFVSSFVVDYNAIGNDTEIDENDENTVTVWMATGRDQFQILRQLINNTYTAETGYQVNLELVNTGAVLSAVVAGIGPDVVLDQPSTEPINFALRNAIYDLKNFSDDKGAAGSKWDLSYTDTLGQFYGESLTPYYFDRKGDAVWNTDKYDTEFRNSPDVGLYALPEKQDFQVMFYRTDVLAAEGIEIPETWGELVSTITSLNKKNLEFGMPNATVSILYAMLRQRGGDWYTYDSRQTALKTEVATKAFKQWTNFYVNYDLDVSYDFKTRFRTGEMPLAIDSFVAYNTLAVSAPEINGRWGYTLIPGTEATDDKGNVYIDHTVHVTTNCSFILKDNINYDLSWKFLKWWISTPTQASFGNQIECILGQSARYNTANLAAFEQLPWSKDDKDMLNEQLAWAQSYPQIAGSYFLQRHINNAFRKVIYQDKDAKDTLYDYANVIDAEINKKRAEFGLPLAETK